MKELELIDRTKVEQHQEQNQKQEYKFVGTVHMQRGCKLFCYDPDNDEMKEIKVSSKGAIDLSGNVIENQKSQYNPKYVYFQSINEKNARKKLSKYKQGLWQIAEQFQEKKFESLPQIF